ncbi:MAG: c-type cytochrome biogenesis protein CcsB [Nitriliruptorales bacterium]|nr:c-type cytochrome biogenesis protein CcsB [Nitriliruptorales bacterium]
MVVHEQLAQTSNTLFTIAFASYLVAMVAYFFRLAYTKVSAEGVTASTAAGRRVGLLATGLAIFGLGVHVASAATRGLAAGRVPWANMYEYSSLMALFAVAAGLIVVQRRFGYGHLMGFVLALAVLTMTGAVLLSVDPGPVVPALDSYWIRIHTSAAMVASSIFMVGFAATALFLVKDTAERRVAGSPGDRFTGSTVGAAAMPPTTGERPEGYVDDRGADLRPAPPEAQRDALSPVLFPVAPFVVVGLFVLVVWRVPVGAFLAASGAALLGIATWYAVPYLPPAAQLDNLGYRTIAFGFPIWTFAILAGAVWAEEAWGRYWGWDPKETGSFFTWTLYAAYLHARSTRGWRGRRAAWTAVAAFAALMVTYYMVNLWIVGLHSYAGV